MDFEKLVNKENLDLEPRADIQNALNKEFNMYCMSNKMCQNSIMGGIPKSGRLKYFGVISAIAASFLLMLSIFNGSEQHIPTQFLSDSTQVQRLMPDTSLNPIDLDSVHVKGR